MNFVCKNCGWENIPAAGRLIDILEKQIIIDVKDEKYLCQADLLMHLYTYKEYDTEKDVIDDGGVPKRIKVKILIFHEDIVK